MYPTKQEFENYLSLRLRDGRDTYHEINNTAYTEWLAMQPADSEAHLAHLAHSQSHRYQRRYAHWRDSTFLTKYELKFNHTICSVA